MNTQEYISSGIIESYVLGLASDEERAEFERLCRQYPELLKARDEFEIMLEKQAMQHGVQPRADLREKMHDSLLSHSPKVVRLDDEKRKAVAPAWWRYAAAACFVLLVASLAWNISQYHRNRKLQSSYDEVARDYDSTAIRLGEIEDEIAMIRQNPNVKMAAMKGMDVSPNSFATVYWDTTSKDVYLLVNNLPQPPSEKQYQLWALLDGKPIDVGMIDNNSFIGEKRLLIQMKNVSGAQAFAITLEEKGGKPVPQGDMYVMGKL